jgi:hypothetical protein
VLPQRQRTVEHVRPRLEGKSFREIAAVTGMSHLVAFRDWCKILSADDRTTAESIAPHRTTWLRRMDKAVAGLWPGVQRG